MKDIEHTSQGVQAQANFNVAGGSKKEGLKVVLSGVDAGVSVVRAVQSGIILDGVVTEAQSGDIKSALGGAAIKLREVDIPSGLARRQKFLAKWSEAARRNAKKGLGFGMLLLPLSACGGDEDDSSSTGFVIDGYIADAFIFRDEDGNGIFDIGEASSRTGVDGSFALGGDETKPIVVDGSDGRARDLDNPSEPFTGVLMAPAGSTVVTPITTLVQQLVEGGDSVAAAEKQIQDGLGITEDVDLLNSDPIATDNVDVYKAGVQVAGLIAAVGGGAAGLAVTAAVAEAIAGGLTLDLTDIDQVTGIIEDAKEGNGPAFDGVDTVTAASVAASKAQVIDAANTIDDVSVAQAATLTVSVVEDVVSFGGTATGAITATLNADGSASFARSGVVGKDGASEDALDVKVVDIANKSIAGSIDLSVVVTQVLASAGDDEIVIDAPDAAKISVSGTSDSGADNIIIKIADKTAGTEDVRVLTLDTRLFAVSGDDKVTFQFAGEEDTVF
jgi:hypothetical protein